MVTRFFFPRPRYKIFLGRPSKKCSECRNYMQHWCHTCIVAVKMFKHPLKHMQVINLNILIKILSITWMLINFLVYLLFTPFFLKSNSMLFWFSKHASKHSQTFVGIVLPLSCIKPILGNETPKKYYYLYVVCILKKKIFRKLFILIAKEEIFVPCKASIR